jgi:trimeric autotransporter adhesin
LLAASPTFFSETSDGNYLFVGIKGAQKLGRINLLSQALDSIAPIMYTQFGTNAATSVVSLAAVPGSDNSVALAVNGSNALSIFDLTGNGGTFRQNSTLLYGDKYPVFADSTHSYAYDGGTFDRFSVDANGVYLSDKTALDGLLQGLALDGGLVYGGAGGIIDPAPHHLHKWQFFPFRMECSTLGMEICFFRTPHNIKRSRWE